MDESDELVRARRHDRATHDLLVAFRVAPDRPEASERERLAALEHEALAEHRLRDSGGVAPTHERPSLEVAPDGLLARLGVVTFAEAAVAWSSCTGSRPRSRSPWRPRSSSPARSEL